MSPVGCALTEPGRACGQGGLACGRRTITLQRTGKDDGDRCRGPQQYPQHVAFDGGVESADYWRAVCPGVLAQSCAFRIMSPGQALEQKKAMGARGNTDAASFVGSGSLGIVLVCAHAVFYKV
jgi:hypothetical protein